MTLLFTYGSFNQLWSGEKGLRLADTRVLSSALRPGLTAVILTAVVLIKFSRTQIKSLILAMDVLFIQLYTFPVSVRHNLRERISTEVFDVERKHIQRMFEDI